MWLLADVIKPGQKPPVEPAIKNGIASIDDMGHDEEFGHRVRVNVSQWIARVNVHEHPETMKLRQVK